VGGPTSEQDVVFRAMIEDAGQPKFGTSAITLGVRRGVDIEADDEEMVDRPSFSPRGKNGVSCAPEIIHLPEFIRPQEWGGRHTKTKVWRIRKLQLGPLLVADQDSPHHVSIGPAHRMPFDEYFAAIQATASQWELVPHEHRG
jgi:hypothetical protein